MLGQLILLPNSLARVFLCSQAAQLTHILNERLKETAEDVDQKRALKYVIATIANEKGEATVAVEKKVADSEKAELWQSRGWLIWRGN